MAFHVIRGRKSRGPGTGASRRRSAVATMLHWRVPPLLFNARLLSTERPMPKGQPVNLTRIVRDVYHRYLQIAQRQKVCLTLHPLPQNFLTQGESVVLHWVVSMLVDYFVYDTPPYGEVALRTSIDGAGTCSLSVTRVIPAPTSDLFAVPWAQESHHCEVRPRVEERVGVATAKRLVSRYSGTLAVIKDEEPETTVVVTLPLLTKE